MKLEECIKKEYGVEVFKCFFVVKVDQCLINPLKNNTYELFPDYVPFYVINTSFYLEQLGYKLEVSLAGTTTQFDNIDKYNKFVKYVEVINSAITETIIDLQDKHFSGILEIPTNPLEMENFETSIYKSFDNNITSKLVLEKK
jgi:hypothetical protein